MELRSSNIKIEREQESPESRKDIPLQAQFQCCGVGGNQIEEGQRNCFLQEKSWELQPGGNSTVQ